MNIFALLTDFDEKTTSKEVIRNDFLKRFQNTIIEVPEKKTLLKAYRFYNEFTLECINIKGERVHLEKTVNIKPFLPDVGYYMIDGKPTYLYKYPQRQWLRSFNGTIYRATNYAIHQDDLLSIAYDIKHTEYAHLDEITKKLFANVALSKTFALFRKHDQYHLFYRDNEIGVVDFDKREIVLTYKALYQEVLDLFKRTGVTTWKLV